MAAAAVLWRTSRLRNRLEIGRCRFVSAPRFRSTPSTGDAAPAAMLRWTCRFRDTLVAKHYQFDRAHQYMMSKMREAEFVWSDEEDRFPSNFRWNEFRKCFSTDYGSVAIGRNDDTQQRSENSPFVDYSSSDFQATHALSGQEITPSENFREKIHVLWLSPNVFVSVTRFMFQGSRVADFKVVLYSKDRWRALYAYSLTGFESDQPDQASSLPFEFLGHLTDTRPAKHFSKVDLSVINRQRVPSTLYAHFHSIIPYSDAAAPRTFADKEWITFQIATEVTRDDLHAIFSHRFHPRVKLRFESIRHSVSIPVFNDLLLESNHLVAVEWPFDEVEDKSSQYYSRMILKSPKLTILYPGLWTCAFLRSFSTMQNINDISIEFHGQTEEFVHLYMQTLFGIESLERLRINFRFEYSCGQADELYVADKVFDVQPILDDVAAEIKFLRREVPRTIPPCMATNLCHLTVTSDTRGLDRIKRLDHHLFPCIVLNYSRKYLTVPLAKGEIALAIAAVNQGKIFCKATDNEPYDMSVANAGPIFCVIKAASRR
jgi:hypothetical protein